MRDICFNRLSVHQSIRYVGINVQTVRWGGGGGGGVGGGGGGGGGRA